MAGEELIGAGIIALIMGMLTVFLIIFGLVWLYMSFAYIAIAKKNKQKSPGLAWIPIVGPSLVSVKAARMHWWPILLLGVVIVPVVNVLAPLTIFVLGIFFIVWNWKMMEAIKKPGWWAIFILVFPVYLVFLGIAAWSEEEKSIRKSKPKIQTKKKSKKKK